MTHIVDTDVLIDAVNGQFEALAALGSLDPGRISLSAISVGELLEGFAGVPGRTRRQHEVESFLEPFRRYDVTFDIMRRFSQVRADLRARGLLIADFDIVIAATAIEHNLMLVTRNKRHFERIPNLRFTSPKAMLEQHPSL